ncbi:hypothetical protein MRX96_002619 [Rhipicephalus microplus]
MVLDDVGQHVVLWSSRVLSYPAPVKLLRVDSCKLEDGHVRDTANRPFGATAAERVCYCAQCSLLLKMVLDDVGKHVVLWSLRVRSYPAPVKLLRVDSCKLEDGHVRDTANRPFGATAAERVS